MDEQTIEDFRRLFEGRLDVLGVDHGGTPWQEKYDEDDPRFDLAWEDHLAGEVCIGTYPLREGRRTRWICSDLDAQHSRREALALRAAWESYGIKAWIETSRSKGYHVWVFLEDWVSGTEARRAGLYIHSYAEVPATEVNPKQEITDGYGNYVRLPYGYHPDEGNVVRNRMLDQDMCVLELEDFMGRALEHLADTRTIFLLANRWEPPQLTARRIDGESASDWDGSVREGYYHIREVFKGNEDVLEGNRDNVLYTLARYMQAREIPYHEAIDVMHEVWSDQVENNHSYPLRNAIEKVERAYS